MLVNGVGDLCADGGDSMKASSRAELLGRVDEAGPKRKKELSGRRLLALCSMKLDECPLRKLGLKHVGILRL